MRQMASLFIVLVVILIIFLKIDSDKQNSRKNVVTLSPTPVTEQISLKINVFRAEKNQKVKLINNLDDKLTGTEISQRNNCLSGINGGFYNQENNPIGLLVINGNIVSEYQQNKLFNGIISMNKSNRYEIGEMRNADDWEWAFQTGPILMKNGVKSVLHLVRDETARRMVAAVDNSNRLILITFYNPVSVYEGPRLEELPETLEQENQRGKWNMINAINLDGGTASGWVSPEANLPEFNSVGSWLCVQPAVSGTP